MGRRRSAISVSYFSASENCDLYKPFSTHPLDCSKSLVRRMVWQVGEEAACLDDLQPARDGVAVTYVCRGSSVRADFEFDVAGRIFFQKCGPSN
jgi:hypothetical protein